MFVTHKFNASFREKKVFDTYDDDYKTWNKKNN